MASKITDLRNHLFETLEALRDKAQPMDIARAKAVADVARVIIDTAKVEVDFLRVRGEVRSTGFLLQEPEEHETTETMPARPALVTARGTGR